MKKISIGIIAVFILMSCSTNDCENLACPIFELSFNIQFIDTETGNNLFEGFTEEEVFNDLELLLVIDDTPLINEEHVSFDSQNSGLRVFLSSPFRIVFSDEFDITITPEVFTTSVDECCGLIPGIRIIEVSEGFFERTEEPPFGYRISI